MRSLLSASVSVLAVLAAAGLSHAQEPRSAPRLLLDRKLAERTVQFTGIDDRTVMYIDSAGQPRTDLLSDYLAILPLPDAAPARAISFIERADGQRITGALIPGRTPPADSLLWGHLGLGVLTLPLDTIRRIQLQGGIPLALPRADESGDTVLLINGDRLDGFVDSIADEVTISTSEAPRAIPSDRVQEIILANTQTLEPLRNPIVWISDGSVLACRSITSNRSGEVVLTPTIGVQDTSEPGTEARLIASETLTMRLDDLRALIVDPALIAPLSSLPIAAQSPANNRRWARPAQAIEPRWAPARLADVELPGPMSVEWELPPAASRFAADVELPRQMWTWGDCEVSIFIISAQGESELWRRRINADSPRARVSAPLPPSARRLRIVLHAGEFGAVQDKVILRRGVVLLDSR